MNLKRFLIVLSIVGISLHVGAQLRSPVPISMLLYGLYQVRTDVQNPCTLYGVEPEAEEGAAIFYNLTLQSSADVIIHTLGSSVQGTEITVRQDNSIISRAVPLFFYYGFLSDCDLWDDTLYSEDQDCYLLHNLPAGTYLVSVKGVETSTSTIVNGEIKTTFIGYQSSELSSPFPPPFYLQGMFERPVQLDGQTGNISYCNDFSTELYRDVQGDAGQDIYFDVELPEKTRLTIQNQDEPFRIYLKNTRQENISTQVVSTSTSLLLQRGAYHLIAEPILAGEELNICIIGEEIHSSTNENATFEEMITEPDLSAGWPQAVGSPHGTFSVGELGNAQYSVQIESPQGIGDMQPDIGIVYNSHAGFGLVGYGCQLSGLSAITRTGSDLYHDEVVEGVSHTMTDNFLLDGKRLLSVSGTEGQQGATYQLEGNPFTSITLKGTASNNYWFEVKTQDGKTYEYGHSTGKQLYTTTANGQRINSWYLDRAEDALGNYITYDYTQDNLFLYPTTIHYGKNVNQSTSLDNTIEFSYETLDPSIQRPFRIEDNGGKMRKVLKAISTKTNDTTFRNYTLNYATSSDLIKFPRLTSVTESNAAGDALRPVQFQWEMVDGAKKESRTINDIYFGHFLPGYTTVDKKFISMDLTGDGLPEIIRFSNLRYGTELKGFIYISVAEIDSNGTLTYPNPNITYNCGPEVVMPDFASLMRGVVSSDLDGDGYQDLFFPYISVDGNNESYAYFRYIKGEEIAHRAITDIKSTQEAVLGIEMPAYITFDFDGDGKDELLYITKTPSNGTYKMALGRSNVNDKIVFSYTNISLPSKPEKLFVGDFNSDGLPDVFIQRNSTYSIYFNNGNAATDLFSDANKINSSIIGTFDFFEQGDFNGDGLLDFIYNITHQPLSPNTDRTVLYYLLNNGDGTFTTQQTGSLSLLNGDATDNKQTLLVTDFNHDGRSDVIIAKAANFSDDGSNYQCGIRWYLSTGDGLSLFRSVNTHNADDACWYNLMIGDFAGNGDACVMNYGSNIYTQSYNTNEEPKLHLYSTPGFTAGTGKVVKFTDGWGNTTDVTYGTTADTSVYTPGTGSPSFPLCLYDGAVPIVKSTTQSNGAAGPITQQYQYQTLKMHRQGRGLLGFDKTTVTNQTLGSVTEQSILQRDATFLQPLSLQTKTTIGTDYTQQTSTYTLIPKGQHNFFLCPTAGTTVGIEGETSIVEHTFDTNTGKPLTETLRNSTGDMYRTTVYGNYTQVAGQHLPQQVTVTQKHRDCNETYSAQTNITYDSRGLPVTTVNLYGTPQQTTTVRTFDTFGNVLTETTTSNSGTDLTHQNVYDSTGRFVMRSGFTTVPYTTYTRDTWGSVLTETTVNGGSEDLTTTYAYDAWGQLASSTNPAGQVTTYTRGWSPDHSGYFTLERPSGAPWVKTIYDSMGREIRTETVGPRGMEMNSTTTYNAQDKPTTQSRQTGELVITTQKTYDDWGRLTSESSSTGSQTQYTYSAYTTEITRNGRTYTQVTDEWGNIAESEDPVSSVAYTYHSNGKPTVVSSEGTAITMAFNARGDRTQIVDPDAGTTATTYLPDGRVSQQTDARGVTTKYAYDQQKRVTQYIVGTDTIAYTFGTSGNEAQQLIREQKGNKAIAYTHDALGRLVTETRTIGNDTYTWTYVYNNKDQLSQKIYPGNLVVTYEYDPYGHLLKTFVGDSLVWWLSSTDGRNQTERFGANLRQTIQRNQQGFLLSQNVSALFPPPSGGVGEGLTYAYHHPTGNLLSRTGMLPDGAEETFTYDDLDRLTTVAIDNETAQAVTYADNGNITSKTGLGTYTYTGSRPHAVNQVQNTGGQISTATQKTTYNALSKIESIEDAGTDYTLNFEYGPDMERWQTELFHGDTLKRTMRYLDDVEIKEENGQQTWYYYIGNALYVKCQATSPNGGGWEGAYLLFCDNLGSVVRIVDSTGAAVFESSYDAWGNQTIAKNDIGFCRGYTGHEMLPEFGLINMNGRLYDPVLGQFLSPDNYVQDPINSQNFNRYAYCLNNPLKYTDPSGELFGIDDILLCAFIGGTINWASHGFQFNAKGLGYFAIGAVAAAAGSGIASGVNVALTGSMSSTGFFAGAAAGASAGFAAGFISGAGNAWVGGSSFGKGILAGLESGGLDALTGGITGGLFGGLDALEKGVNFWDGTTKVDLNGAFSCMDCDPQDLINTLKEYYEKIRVKYVGLFVDQNVYESKFLGSIITPANDGKLHFKGFTVPERGIIVGEGVFTSGIESGKALMQHEYGHILQYRKVGMYAYYKVIAPESMISACRSSEAHGKFWTETWANYLSKQYFRAGWLGNNWDYPVSNISNFNNMRIKAIQIQGLLKGLSLGFL